MEKFRKDPEMCQTDHTSQNVVLIVLVGFCSHLDETRQTFSHHKLVDQIFVILRSTQESVTNTDIFQHSASRQQQLLQLCRTGRQVHVCWLTGLKSSPCRSTGPYHDPSIAVLSRWMNLFWSSKAVPDVLSILVSKSYLEISSMVPLLYYWRSFLTCFLKLIWFL